MKTILAIVLAVVTTVVYARAGTLAKCDFISTQQGPRWVGTYCVDYNCQYTVTYVFTSYCPFMKP